ncbi:MAG: hypothetical protein ACNS61_00420 [Candidatus Wenzhouxiangella sp. M2_3B_020]
MTESSRNRSNRDLERLYRDGGEVEPGAGIDRMIRARAEQAASRRSKYRRAPWIGGLVTASVAVVAVAVVLQQSPPAGRVPEAPAPPAGPDEDRAASDRQAVGESGVVAGDDRRTGAPARREAEAALGANDSFTTQRSPSAGERAGAPDRARAELAAEAPPDGKASEEGEAVQNTIEESLDRAIPGPIAAKLVAIRKLIEGGEIERARARLESFRTQHPDIAVPPDLVAALEEGPPGG